MGITIAELVHRHMTSYAGPNSTDVSVVLIIHIFSVKECFLVD